MTTANFTFLLDYDPQQANEELQEYALSELEEWHDNYADSNNWYHPGFIIKPDDTYIHLECPTLYTESAEWESFDSVLKFALQCVAQDMELFGTSSWSWLDGSPKAAEDRERLENLSFGDLRAAIDKEVPKRLADAYTAIVGEPSTPDNGYQRRHLAVAYELLRGAGAPPFAVQGSPYEYRAFDLRKHNDLLCKEESALMIVSMHT